MVPFLPLFFATLAGVALVLMLTALWQSVRGVLVREAGQGAAPHPQSAAREKLLREKQELLQAIRDVRFEHDLGKLSQSDFERLDDEYRARAREILQQLDAQLAPYREQARAMLGEVAASTEAAKPSVPASASATPAAASGACPSCGAANDADALFCKKCGTRLAPAAAEAS